MASSTKEDDMVITTAHQIVRNLAFDKTVDDMHQIFSTFDNRFSYINFNQHSTALRDAVSADASHSCTTEKYVIVGADDDEDVAEKRIDIQLRLDNASERSSTRKGSQRTSGGAEVALVIESDAVDNVHMEGKDKSDLLFGISTPTAKGRHSLRSVGKSLKKSLDYQHQSR